MNKAFEKILDMLSNIHRVVKTDEDAEWNRAIYKSTEIVQEVTKEYNVGWIACSERLPKYGEVVMCSCSNGGITISCITHKGVKQSKVVRFGTHSVVAWQPLPEPYKERD